MTSAKPNIRVQFTEVCQELEAEKANVVIADDFREKRTVKKSWREGGRMNTLIQNGYLLVKERIGRKESFDNLERRALISLSKSFECSSCLKHWLYTNVKGILDDGKDELKQQFNCLTL